MGDFAAYYRAIMPFFQGLLRKRRRVSLLLAVTGILVLIAGFGRPWLAMVPNALARRALGHREPDVALDWIRWSERLAGPSGETELILARAHRKLARWDAVRDHLSRARSLGATENRVQREDWLAQAQSGQLRDVEHRRNLMLLDPQGDTDEICEAYAQGYLLNRRFLDAIELLQSWSADYPENPQPHFLLGMTYADRSKTTLAVRELQRAVQLEPSFFRARLALANALLENKQPAEALAEFQVCRGLKHSDQEVSSGLARSFLALGSIQEAEIALEQGVREFPDNFTLRFEFGRFLMNDDFDAALVQLEKATAIEPRNTAARYALAQVLLRLQRKDEAAGHLAYVETANQQLAQMQKLTDAVQTNPADVEARFGIGMTELKYGTEEHGIQWLQSVLEYDPLHKAANEALAAYYESRQTESTKFAELASRYRSKASTEPNR